MDQVLQANIARARAKVRDIEMLSGQLRFNIERFEKHPERFAEDQMRLAAVALILRDQCTDLSNLICEITS